MALHFQTPTYESAALSDAAGRKVWIKLESLQPSGSFKMRGVGYACEYHAARGARRFVSSSGGNAGIAVACAGKQLGIPVAVYVPETTSARAVGILTEMGAGVTIYGASWQEANALATSELSSTDAFIHPFDDPLLWTGHSSLVDEVVKSGVSPDLIVLSVGGGGLLSGVVEGLKRHGLRIPVLTVETVGAASLAQSEMAGKRITLPNIDSIATSLGARRVSEHAFALLGEHPIKCAVVTDSQAVNSCLRFVDDHRILTEPACGASLAAAYNAIPELGAAKEVLVIVCGGTTASYEQCAAWYKKLTTSTS